MGRLEASGHTVCRGGQLLLETTPGPTLVLDVEQGCH